MLKPSKMQAEVLAAASERTDAVINVPPELKGAARRAFATGLIGQGWAHEKRNRRGATAGPASLKTQVRPSLVITALGRKVIARQHEAKPDAIIVSPEQKAGTENGPAKATKQALVIGLLARPDGASCDELMAATSWLSHTVRAALVRLRQKGLSIIRSQGEDGISRYRLVEAAAAAA